MSALHRNTLFSLEKYRRGLEYLLARLPIMKRIYWRYVKKYYQWRIRKQINSIVNFEAPLDPVKIVFVDPDDISYFTGRKNPSDKRWKSIGRVVDGDWDKTNPEYPDVPLYLKKLTTAEQIEDTILYRSIYNHFINRCPWSETKLFRLAKRGINEGHEVLRSNSEDELLERCHQLDTLYENIVDVGYLSQFEIASDQGIKSDRVGYLDLLTDEINVDIGRKGELLFADGRHRLCIAKVAEIDFIPVVILVRHRKWIHRRDQLYNAGGCGFHPDLVERK